MGRIYTSFETMSRAYNKVRMELSELGVLWNGSKLDQVPCFHVPFAPFAAIGGIMGWYDYERKRIEFPSVYLPALSLIFDLGAKTSTADVLRHEFGHALADLYPEKLKRGGTFRAAFGGCYGNYPPKETCDGGWEERHVSKYASTATQEDFAETFMLYVKHRRDIPVKFAKKPAIRKKWEAVDEIVHRVAASAL